MERTAFFGMALAALVAGIGLTGRDANGAPARGADEAWSFEMWCLEMQLYPAKRCDAKTAEDLHDYAQYRADVENYHQPQAEQQKRDQQILERLNRNLPGSTGLPAK